MCLKLLKTFQLLLYVNVDLPLFNTDTSGWTMAYLANAVTATVLPSLKEPPQLHFSAEPPFFRGLVLDRLSLLLSRPLLPPPLPLPL